MTDPVPAIQPWGSGTMFSRARPRLPTRLAVLHLAGAIGLGLFVRLAFLFAPLQIDEFPVVHAIAGRRTPSPGMLPAASDPLVRVESAEIVRYRSVLPYGIGHPWPLFNYIEYLVVKAFPVAEWSLRLPSLLAGLATIPVIYLVCRTWAGHPTALLAALLTAVEPLQVVSSTIARPYALGNFVIALTCLLLQALLSSSGLRARAGAAGGIGLAIACLGYLNPVLLYAVPAYLLLIAAAALRTRMSGSGVRVYPVPAAGALAIALALSILLLLPLREYIFLIRENFVRNREYLRSDWIFLGAVPRWGFFLEHNASLIAGLCVLAMFPRKALRASSPAGMSASERPGTAADAPSPLAGWLAILGLALVVVPQYLVLMHYAAGGQGAFLSRYLCYTSLGGILLLSSLWEGVRQRHLKRGIAVMLLATMLLLCFHRQGRGFHLETAHPFLPQSVPLLNALHDSGLWQEGDVVLYQPHFIEADFLPDGIPEKSRREVHNALLSPLSTLAAPQHALPVVTLSMSNYRGLNEVRTGRRYRFRSRLYNEDLAERLKSHHRYWLLVAPWDRAAFLSCLLPWMADALETDLLATEVVPATRCDIVAKIRVQHGLAESADPKGLEAGLGRHGNALILVEPSRSSP